jgi:hypothetical protein
MAMAVSYLAGCGNTSFRAESAPAAAKSRIQKQCTYRSGKPLRHPKSSAKSSFSAAC